MEARCDLSNLQASVGSRQEIGSTTYIDVTFTNEGSSCWISGFPQVLFAPGGATVSEAARDGEIRATCTRFLRVGAWASR